MTFCKRHNWRVVFELAMVMHHYYHAIDGDVINLHIDIAVEISNSTAVLKKVDDKILFQNDGG